MTGCWMEVLQSHQKKNMFLNIWGLTQHLFSLFHWQWSTFGCSGKIQTLFARGTLVWHFVWQHFHLEFTSYHINHRVQRYQSNSEQTGFEAKNMAKNVFVFSHFIHHFKPISGLFCVSGLIFRSWSHLIIHQLNRKKKRFIPSSHVQKMLLLPTRHYVFVFCHTERLRWLIHRQGSGW